MAVAPAAWVNRRRRRPMALLAGAGCLLIMLIGWFGTRGPGKHAGLLNRQVTLRPLEMGLGRLFRGDWSS